MKRFLQIYRDGRLQTEPLTTELLDGEQGNLQTLRAMARIVNEDRGQPDLRVFVERHVLRDVGGHDAAGELAAIHRFARDEIVYRRDPWGYERVADLWSTLYHPALNPNGKPVGDCGTKTLFIATCAAILGHKPFFVVVKQRAEQTAYNHVYNAVLIDGQLKFYDATPAGAEPGWQPDVEVRMLFEIF